MLKGLGWHPREYDVLAAHAHPTSPQIRDPRAEMRRANPCWGCAAPGDCERQLWQGLPATGAPRVARQPRGWTAAHGPHDPRQQMHRWMRRWPGCLPRDQAVRWPQHPPATCCWRLPLLARPILVLSVGPPWPARAEMPSCVRPTARPARHRSRSQTRSPDAKPQQLLVMDAGPTVHRWWQALHHVRGPSNDWMGHWRHR
mmetsp:Transcript_62244/g.176799  ORF Transcript_62244/g.176799 Transcript_62244/m.176799 type:complete len:200 (-) Transcript_62244:991-1590(-)